MPTLYRFMSMQNALKSLESRRLRIGRLADLNDPFDCALHFTGASKNEQPLCQLTANTIFRNRSETLGILCFTRTWKEPVLWSHYADSHRGVALVFKFPKRPNFHKVKYSKRRKSIPIEQLRDDSKTAPVIAAMGESFTIKSPTWRYERETRLLIELGQCDISDGSYFISFERDVFKGVIMGLRCDFSPNYFRRIFSKIEMPNAKVWRSKQSAEGFSLDREEPPKH